MKFRIGDIVHYFKLVVPHTGPATAAHGELETHVAMIVGIRDGAPNTLKVTDHDGNDYVVRRAVYSETPREGCWIEVRR